jgi:hypothetical protein
MNLLLRAKQEEGDLRTEGMDLSIKNPPTRVVKWYWRLGQSAPSLPLAFEQGTAAYRYQCPSKYHLSYALADYEADGRGTGKFLERVENYLLFTPWLGDGEMAVYQQAIARGVPGLLRDDFTVDLPSMGYLTEAMAGVFGDALTKYWEEAGIPWVLAQIEGEDNGEAQG